MKRPLTPRQRFRGYVLTELLVAMGLSAFIVVGMGLVLQSQERAYRAQGSGMEDLRVLHAAVDRLQQDLQMAGYGLPPNTLPAIVPGNGTGSLLVTIRYLTDAPFTTTLTAHASDKSELFRISPDASRHFRRGDQVILHRDGAWLAFRVRTVESGVPTGLTPDPEILRPAEDASALLLFPGGSQVIRLRDAEVQYLLERGQRGHLRLIRRRGEQETVVAVGLRDIRFEYLAAQPGGGDPPAPQWTPQPQGATPVLGTRVRLAVGRTSIRFTATPRNLIPTSPS